MRQGAILGDAFVLVDKGGTKCILKNGASSPATSPPCWAEITRPRVGSRQI